MAIVEHYDKRVGITYVYESQSYYDKEKHQSRSKRKLIGKKDPETGEIIPTGKKGRPSKYITSKDDGEPDYKNLYEISQKELDKKEKYIEQLSIELHEAELVSRKYKDIIDKIATVLGNR